jgi:ferrous iron transport protein A
MKVGQKGRIAYLMVEGLARRRLLDLGLLPGTEVIALMKSPLGSPVAYKIRDSVLALRLEDASNIVMESLPPECDKGGH